MHIFKNPDIFSFLMNTTVLVFEFLILINENSMLFIFIKKYELLMGKKV